MTLHYVNGSIDGSTMSTSFSRGFRATIKNSSEHTKIKSQSNTVNYVAFLEVTLPTIDHDTCELKISSHVTTNIQGLVENHATTQADIRLLRLHWETLRADALADDIESGSTKAAHKRLIATFDRVSSLMTAKQLYLYAPDPNYPFEQRLSLTKQS
jgi:hypothetical protein